MTIIASAPSVDALEGETKLSPRTRFLTIVGGAAGAWGLIIAVATGIAAH